MEEKVNPWKANLTNGLILGLVGVVYSLLMYFLNLSLNKSQSYVFMIVQIVVLYFLLKSYRDNFMHGQITIGQSVSAGVIINIYYAVIMAIFTYILYTVIDTGLIAKQLAINVSAYNLDASKTWKLRTTDSVMPQANTATKFMSVVQDDIAKKFDYISPNATAREQAQHEPDLGTIPGHGGR